MGDVSFSLNNRSYRFRCRDGEEAHLRDLAAYLREHVDRLAQAKGEIGDERLVLMAALTVTDELFEARKNSDAAEKGGKIDKTDIASREVPGSESNDDQAGDGDILELDEPAAADEPV